MHIKRLLSGSLAAMMVATSFNVPINVKAAEVPDTEPAAGLEENQELPSSDAEIPVDDDTNVVVEEPAEEPEVVTPEAEVVTPEAEAPVEETTEETPTEELVVEEETAEQEVVGEVEPVTFTVKFNATGADAETVPTDITNAQYTPAVDGETPTEEVPYSLAEPSQTPTKTGFTFKGWSKTESGAIVTFPLSVGSADVTGTDQKVFNLYAIFEATETKVDISTLDIEFKPAVYTGSAITPVIKSVKKGEQTFDAEDFNFKVYETAAKAETELEGDAANPINAGKYYVVVSSTAEKYKDAENQPTKKTVEFTVDKRELKAEYIKLGDDKTDGTDIGDASADHTKKSEATATALDKYNLYYYTKDVEAVVDNPETADVNEAKPAKVKGVDAYEVNPIVSIPEITAVSDNPDTEEDETVLGLTGIAAQYFEVTYSNNSAVGKAKVTVTLKDDTLKANFTSATVEKEFEIEDGETADAVTSWTAAAADKAKLAAEPTTGTETGYGPTYSKKFTRTIPAVDISSIKTKGSRLEKDFDEIEIDKIYDTEGKDISSQFEIKSRTAGDDKGTIVVAAKSDAAQYTGEYSFEYSFATKDCDVDGHTYTKHIHKADFEHDGEFWYECDDCGLRPESASDVEGVENDEDLTGTIKHLNKASVDFWITNGETEYKFSEVSEGIPYLGESITVVQNNAKNALIKNSDSSITVNAVDYATEEGEKDVINFEITPSNNDKVGTAKFVIALADDNENYTGSIVKEVEIVKNVETVEVPKISSYSASYGDKLELTSATEGAKILYQISEDLDTDDFEPITDLSNAEKIKAFVEHAKTQKYEDPITVAEKNAISGKIKITAIAYKTVEGKNVYSGPGYFEVNTRWSWGDVDDYGADGPTSADKIPAGLWISVQTMETLTDRKTEDNSSEASFDDNTKSVSAAVTYSGFAKTLPNYTLKYSGSTYKSTDDYRVFYNNEKLRYGTDYTISYKNNTNAGTAQIIVTGKGKYAETFVQEFTIAPKSLATINGETINDAYYSESNLIVAPQTTVGTDYRAVVVSDNGKLQKPKFVLNYVQKQYTNISTNAYKYVYKKLVEGKDFEVDYSQVKAAVTGETPYPIQIRMIGNYTTSAISPELEALAGNIGPRNLYVVSAGRNISKANVAVDAKNIVLDGDDKSADVKTTVKLEGVTLVPGTDYEVKYEYNSKIPGYYPATGVYSVGSYNAMIVGKGDYVGYVNKTFSVPASAAKKINAKGITATPVNSTIAVTNANSQTFVVNDNGDVLTLGKDYVVVKPTAKVAKNVKATIYGIGAYTGTLASEKYEITGQTPTVEIVGDSVIPYTGSWISPAIKISVPNTESGKADETYVIPENNGWYETTDYSALNGEQFDIVWPKDSTNVGKKTVTIKGRNGNKFKTTLKYEIVAKDITEIASNDFKVYDDSVAKGLKIEDADELPVIAYTNAAPMVRFEYNGYPYTSASSLGKANATFTFKKGFKYGSTVTVTIKGKKNFKGQVTGTFKIGSADIAANTSATVSDVVENAKFKAPTVKVVSDLTGKTLAAGAKKDYTVKYLYNSNTEAHNRYDEVVTSEKMVAGTEYIARIIGAGNGFEGQKDIVFRVVDKKLDIAKATVTVNRKLLFDGKEAKLDKNDITVVLNKEVVPSEGFEIVGYTLPRDAKTGALKAGTAKVKLHGVSDGTTTYGGYKEVSFTIAAAPVDYAIQFKADRFADGTNELLTIGKVQNTMTNKKDDTFVLPKTGFKATRTVYNATTKKYVTTNYVLKNYYLESDPSQTFAGGQKLNIAEDLGAEKGKAVTLVAKFEKASTDPYTITFKPGKAGTTTATGNDKTVKVKRGDVYKLPKQNFTLAGYKLTGYATTEGGSQVYAIGDSVSNLAAAKTDVKLYGVYEKVLPTYKITYKLDGGKITSAKGKYSTSYNETTDGILPTVEKTGYTLTKWQVDGKDATVVDKALKKNVEATPVWKENEYTLVYNDNIPGTSSADAAVSGTQKYTTKQELKAAPTTTNTELTFLGWAKDKGSVKADYKAGAKNVTFLTEDGATLKLYGVWKHQTYKLSFKLDSADAKAGAKITRPGDTTFTVAGKDSIELAKAIKAGEDFKEWKLGETTYEVSDAAKIAALQAAIVAAKDAKKAVELIAVFAENTKEVNVTYSTGVEGYTIEAGTIKKDGTLKAASFDATKAPANKVFAGWTATGSSKDFYKAGSTIKFADATGSTPITLAPTYTDATASITYDLDGGVFDSDYTVPREWNALAATTITDTASDVTKTGYTFKGFKLASDTAENPTKVTSISLATNGNNGKVAPVSLKAMYDVKTADVTLNLNGGALEDADAAATAWGSGAKKNVKYTDEVTLPTPKARVGYTFEGWYRTAPEKAVKNLKISKVLSNLTYNALWEPVEYKVTLTLNGCELDADDISADDGEDGKWVVNKDKTTATKAFTIESSAISVPTLTKDNYTVVIKTGSGDSETTATTVAAGSHANVEWRAVATENKKLTITFKDGSNTATQTIYSGATGAALKLDANGFTPAAGKKFKDWKRVTEGTTLADTFAGPWLDKAALTSSTFTLDEDKTLVLEAEWDDAVNTVTFYYRDGSTENKIITVSAGAESVAGFPSNPSRSGFKFMGWFKKINGTGTAITSENALAQLKPSVGSEKTNVYAVWEQEYTITYVGADGNSFEDFTGAEYTAPAKYTKLDDVTLPVAANITLESGTFAGWYEVASAEADIAADATPVTTIAKGTTGNKIFKMKVTETP